MTRRHLFSMLFSDHAERQTVLPQEQYHPSAEQKVLATNEVSMGELSEDYSFAPDKERATLQSGLEPYTQTLDRRRALHLVRRLSFAPSYALVGQLVGKTAQEALAIVLGATATVNQPTSLPGKIGRAHV